MTNTQRLSLRLLFGVGVALCQEEAAASGSKERSGSQPAVAMTTTHSRDAARALQAVLSALKASRQSADIRLISAAISPIATGFAASRENRRVDGYGFNVAIPGTIRSYRQGAVLLSIFVTGQGPAEVPRELCHELDEQEIVVFAQFPSRLVGEYVGRAKKKITLLLGASAWCRLQLRPIVRDLNGHMFYPKRKDGVLIIDEHEVPIALSIIQGQAQR